MLASTPAGIDGWYFDPSESQLRNRAESCCCDATLYNAEEVIKAIKHACCNYIGNTTWAVVADLEGNPSKPSKFMIEQETITYGKQEDKRSQYMRYHKEII